jgi:hypothetical protein
MLCLLTNNTGRRTVGQDRIIDGHDLSLQLILTVVYVKQLPALSHPKRSRTINTHRNQLEISV